MQNTKLNIPAEVREITEKLNTSGFSAYIVGGCVRDTILGVEPKDWDITTNATPEQIQNIFPDSFYENTFGTVGIKTRSEDESLSIVEATPYRLEGKYSDNRHPDEVIFAKTIEEDLLRRDFTVNAIAYDPINETLVDPYDGQADLKNKVLKAVGNPKERFEEDALRIMRMARFASQLNFSIDYETLAGAMEKSSLVKNISAERIRDEFVKMIMTKNPSVGISILSHIGVIEYFLPELLEGVKCEQGGAHIFDVYEHLIQALTHAVEKDWPLHIRLSALFHDIGKPRTKRPGKLKPTFYGHEVVGARMVEKIMTRMKFPKNDIELVAKFVRWHMFFSDTEQITLSAVRRMIANVSPTSPEASRGKSDDFQNHPIWDLMRVRECDRVGMKKKEAPYRLRKYHAMIEECLRDPISVKQLKINGEDLMELGKNQDQNLH